MKQIVSLLLSIAVCGALQAATISVDGTDVTFTYDKDTLFGEGNVVGNNIFFSPTTFRAESNNIEGVDTINQTLNITVEVRNESLGNYEITEFALVELGDYFLDGNATSVTANGRLQVESLNELCPIPGFPGFTQPCQDSELFDAGTLTAQGVLTAWNAGTSIDLADTDGWGSDVGVIAQIQNNLSATSTVNGQQAWIEKKSAGVGLIVNPVVPVPAAAWLFASALGLLGWVSKKRTLAT